MSIMYCVQIYHLQYLQFTDFDICLLYYYQIQKDAYSTCKQSN